MEWCKHITKTAMDMWVLDVGNGMCRIIRHATKECPFCGAENPQLGKERPKKAKKLSEILLERHAKNHPLAYVSQENIESILNLAIELLTEKIEECNRHCFVGFKDEFVSVDELKRKIREGL